MWLDLPKIGEAVGLRVQNPWVAILFEATLYGFTPDTELRHDTPLLVSTLLDGNRFTGRVTGHPATRRLRGEAFLFHRCFPRAVAFWGGYGRV